MASHVLTLLVLALVATLTPLAYADPPDPTWMGGYWDDDDFDNVIDFITRADAVVGLPRPDVGSLSATVVKLRSLKPCATPLVVHAFGCTRAPPLNLSIA